MLMHPDPLKPSQPIHKHFLRLDLFSLSLSLSFLVLTFSSLADSPKPQPNPSKLSDSIPSSVSNSNSIPTQPISLDWIYRKKDLGIRPPDALMPQILQWSPHSHWLAYTLTDRSSNTTVRWLNADHPESEIIVSIVDFQSQFQSISRVGGTSPALPSTAAAGSLSNSAPASVAVPSLSWLPNTNLLKVHWGSDTMTYDVALKRWSLTTPSASTNRVTITKPKPPAKPKHAQEIQDSPNRRWSAFVRSNDLYLFDSRNSKETRITRDGSATVLNGFHSWVYWEEILNRATWRAFHWSPRSDAIAFLRTDESSVTTYPVTDFSETVPETRMQRYPKAGTTNPSVKLGIYHLGSRRVRWVDWARDGRVPIQEIPEYIACMTWIPDGSGLLIQTLNRAQNGLTVWRLDTKQLQLHKLFAEESKAWVDVFGDPLFLGEHQEFLWISERSGYRHLEVYGLDGTRRRTLTSGDWDAGSPFSMSGIRYDHARDVITFPALRESPMDKHFYEVPRMGGSIRRLTQEAGSHSLNFSPDGRFAIDRWSSVEHPQVLDLVDLVSTRSTRLASISAQAYEPYRLRPSEIRQFSDKDGNRFYYRITFPEGFDAQRKYPAIAHVYGEPAGQVVRNSSGDPWDSVLAEKGFVVMSFDARGTPGRGRKWLESIQGDQGTVPLSDWRAWVQHLGGHGFIDTNRLGVWGWSGGGTMTCQLMLRTPGLFKAGAAVAAVTDKRLYDTVYTERYLGLPDKNPEGYKQSSPLNFASQLQGNLLIAHGISDDNVHIQNAYQLLTALTQSGKNYELYLYPQKDHGIGGEDHRLHLFQRILEFFERSLIPP